MDSLQAAFVNIGLEYLDDRIKSRVASAKIYTKILAENGIKQILSSHNYEENGYCNVCLIDASIKTKLQQKFSENGIGFGNIYPSAMSEQLCSPKYMNKRFGGNNSIVLGQTVFNLPLFPYMTDDELNRVTEVFLKSLKELA
jgi:dTDP-4-amino-4,6-dideoxygalactose transaminase